MSSGSNKRQRTEQFNVRLTPEEAKRLREEAARAGITPATVLRNAWHNVRVVEASRAR
jgi:hypothetical protein